MGDEVAPQDSADPEIETHDEDDVQGKSGQELRQTQEAESECSLPGPEAGEDQGRHSREATARHDQSHEVRGFFRAYEPEAHPAGEQAEQEAPRQEDRQIGGYRRREHRSPLPICRAVPVEALVDRRRQAHHEDAEDDRGHRVQQLEHSVLGRLDVARVDGQQEESEALLGDGRQGVDARRGDDAAQIRTQLAHYQPDRWGPFSPPRVPETRRR